MRFQASSVRGALKFSEFDESNAGDGFYFAQSIDGCGGGGGFGNIDLNNGEGLAVGYALALSGVRAAQSEVGDVDRVFAEDGADATDDAGDVVVADGDEGAVEWGFDVDAIVAEQAGRVSVED